MYDEQAIGFLGIASADVSSLLRRGEEPGRPLATFTRNSHRIDDEAAEAAHRPGVRRILRATRSFRWEEFRSEDATEWGTS